METERKGRGDVTDEAYAWALYRKRRARAGALAAAWLTALVVVRAR